MIAQAQKVFKKKKQKKQYNMINKNISIFVTSRIWEHDWPRMHHLTF